MKIASKTLKSGLKTLVIQSKDVETITIHFRGKAGSNYEKPTQIGASHLLEHLILNNNPEVIYELGGKVLGITSRDDILYMIKVLKEDVQIALEFLAENFINPYITIKAIETQKNIISQEIKRAVDMPEKYLGRLSNKTLFPNSRMASLNTGSLEEVKILTKESLLEFATQNNHAKNFILVASGNIEPEEFFTLAEKAFKKIPKGKITNSIELEARKDFIIQHSQRVELNQTYFKIDYYGYKLEDDNHYITEVLSKIIDYTVVQKIKKELGYSYRINCASFSSGNYGTVGISGATSTETFELCIKEIKNILNNADLLIKVKILEQVKTNLITEFLFDMEKTSMRADFYSQMWLHGNEIKHLQEIENYKKVTIDDVKKALENIQNQHPKITIISNMTDEKIREIITRSFTK